MNAKDRVHQIRRELAQLRGMVGSIPSLGCNQPWARAWRKKIADRLNQRIRNARRRLRYALRDHGLREEVKLWQPRPASASDSRIHRQYDSKSTLSMWE
jgi:hypothetical protein